MKTKNQFINDTSIEHHYIYAKGQCNLLRKIQGNSISDDKLKSKVELYINLLSIPFEGSFGLEIYILEKSSKLKLASIPSHQSQLNKVEFKDVIEMDYFFERNQSIQIEVNGSSSAVFTEKISKIAGNMKNGVRLSANGFEIEIKFSPIKSETKLNKFLFEIVDLNMENAVNKGIFQKGKEYFYVLYNFNDNVKWRSVYKSEESSNLKFSFANIYEDDLYLGDQTRHFNFDLFVYGEKDPVLNHSFSINDVINNKGLIPLSSEFMLSVKIEQIENLSFTTLLKKGLQISLIVGIDFTGSNGHYKDNDSLHYLSNQMNSYEKSILSCGKIISSYDSDNQYPVFGFGGIPKGKFDTDHAFPLTFSSNPCVFGIEGILNSYKNALTVCELSGPTFFAPLLNRVYEFVSSNKEGTYFILMIITDGIINDIDETIDAIVKSSSLPLSLIIIGVGDADFSAMSFLDGDDMPLKDSNNRFCQRDIVQFVEFSKYENDLSKLREEVLKEIPTQVEVYYRMTKKI